MPIINNIKRKNKTKKHNKLKTRVNYYKTKTHNKTKTNKKNKNKKGGSNIATNTTNNNIDLIKYNTYANDISRQIKMSGGKKQKQTRKYKGGSILIPQDLVNLGRQLTTGLGNTYNTFNGLPLFKSPLPWKDQY
jgi:hypothetical protein